MSVFARLRSPKYSNTGSVARDHLASERTFLAWLRTGLGFVALGMAVERFSQFDLTDLLLSQAQAQASQSAQPPQRGQGAPKLEATDGSTALVAALLGTGGGTVLYGSTRYFSTLRTLEKGLFVPAYYGPGVLGLAMAGLAGTVYWNTTRAEDH
ncbi:MAG: hypothetical protein CYPHOPRED_002680 [Cyphobasidiales sp. Tagirdzhanova-0007]|nr:MAG: hypothetical protein CYPHOPRED_002680 [Cyphobasidiales sp. Tagirdzhanova-0007]